MCYVSEIVVGWERPIYRVLESGDASSGDGEICAIITGMLEASLPPIFVSLVEGSAQRGKVHLASRV